MPRAYVTMYQPYNQRIKHKEYIQHKSNSKLTLALLKKTLAKNTVISTKVKIHLDMG